jgi:hypothetical protein
VLTGFLDVGAEHRVIVGPGQQVRLSAHHDPTRVEKAALTNGERATVTDLQFLIPPPRFSRPTAGDSPALKKLLSDGKITVGYNPSHATKNTMVFVKLYFSALAKTWGITSSVIQTRRAAARDALRNRNIALWVTTTTPTPSVDSELFLPAEGVRWYLEFVRDDTYRAAIRSYLLASLKAGRYGSTYRKAYDGEPSYSPLRSLIFG